MTGRVNQPGFTNIGGVNFQTSAVKKDPIYGLPTYQPELRVTNDNKVQELYCVQLVDGTSIMYPEQAKENNAHVSVSCYGSNYENPCGVAFHNINGARITDTLKDDNYTLVNCSDTNLNAKRDSVTTHGYMSGPGVVYHEYERTHSEDKDKIRVLDGDNVNVNYTTGFDTFEKH